MLPAPAAIFEFRAHMVERCHFHAVILIVNDAPVGVQNGAIPFAPHLLFPQFLDDGKPAERAIGMFMGMVLLGKCEQLWVFGGTISDCAVLHRKPAVPSCFLRVAFRIPGKRGAYIDKRPVCPLRGGWE